MGHSDVIVVGLGAVGGAAAYHLALSGADVLGLDRFSPPHTMGSSHGDTRITRQAVGEGEEYVPFVMRSHELWRELEDVSGETLLHQTGALLMAPADAQVSMHGSDDFMGATTSLASRHGIRHEVVPPDEISKRYPQFHLDGDYTAYYEPGAGYVRSDAAVRTHLDVAARAGATIRHNEPAVSIESTRDGVVVATDRDTYSAATAVVTSGAWLPELLPPTYADLFTVYRQTLVWFGIGEPALATVPVFIWQFGSGEHDVFYGFPAIDGPDGGLKIGTENYAQPTDAWAASRDVAPAEIDAIYDRCVRGRVPGLRAAAVRSAACLYTVTPDFGFVIDRLPGHDNIMVASACSGHGFKHSPAVGEAIAQMTLGMPSRLSTDSFRLGRFQ